ncbi:MAG: hypothetical protein IJY50_06560 [Clostridia bacterium]|nr:hypothetical protein [Clostridia bacterium]
MTYSKLPPIDSEMTLTFPHFPSRFHAVVFRLWETVKAERIAAALKTSVDTVNQTAAAMGLPPQENVEIWERRGYITTIRNVWHLLPYDQLLAVLDWDEDRLAVALKDEDFLDVKLGPKPACDPVMYTPLDEKGIERLQAIRATSQAHFTNLFGGAKPFAFFETVKPSPGAGQSAEGLRMIYSYCGLYANVLEQDIALSYPEALLAMYRDAGVNAVWLPVVLYQMVPFYFDESYSAGWEARQQRLRTLVERAEQYGIKVYLYLNEPRCMPLAFFKDHPDLQGKTESAYAALCSSDPRVLEYLRYGVRTLCRAVPGLGGFFTITCSENLTHCRSHKKGEPCPRCKDLPIAKLVADVITVISEESRAVDPSIRTIAWTWAWDGYMTKEEICECIDRLPPEVIVQCNSETKLPFTVGGISGTVSDYSMSLPGPAELAKYIWNYARSRGHEVCAKVQVNVTWECSTLPFLPVFDLIRQHMSGLRETGVEHLMLSWTLGGYPSINLQVASECLSDPSEQRYVQLLEREFGTHASAVKRAATLFSDAFRQFPFHIGTIYVGPQNAGPSNLLYRQPTGLSATMTCYAFDDLEHWRSIYPRDVFLHQLKLLSEGWKQGLDELHDLPDCAFLQAAKGGYALFRSSYLQSLFIDKREQGDADALKAILEEERTLALLMYDLMQKSPLFGYEAANHYYFNRTMLAEKVLNCEALLAELS